MSSRPISDEEAVAAADKEMEERANRAKALLSQRYVGLKRQQVSPVRKKLMLSLYKDNTVDPTHLSIYLPIKLIGGPSRAENAIRTSNGRYG